MKKLEKVFANRFRLFAMLLLGFLTVSVATACSNIDLESMYNSLAIVGGAGITYATLPIWFKLVDTVKTFVKLDEEAVKALTPEERALYYKSAQEDLFKTVGELKAELAKATTDEVKIKNLEETISAQKRMFDVLEKTQINQGELIAKINKGSKVETISFASNLKAAWDSGLDALKLAEKNRGVHQIEVKATQTYGDITAGLDFAQMRPGVIDKPVRMPRFRSLFGVIPLATEFYKYTQQTSVIRDAQNVAKCAAVTSTTKEELTVANITTKVVKDQISFCRMFVADYPFMASRINKLINESISLRVDEQILLGDGIGENLFSIDYYASEFSAINPVCDISLSIQAANMVDLILGMQTQIIELGEQNGFDPDTVIVNKCDWFKNVESLKDLDNNYLDSRVSVVNGIPYIGGMQVIWSPIVVQNTVYVFDSRKGEIIDRQELIIEVAFENKDNWEKQIADLQGYERLNFLVPSELQNAFMKSTDVAAAITAITKI
jgi:hypothetical protein